MKTVRWGIVGCGDVTEVKSGPALQLATGSELVAVMRRDGAKAADYARRHGVARWYDDGPKLITDPGVDAVYVATPPSTHEHYAMMALAAGKPCYVEKPMARNAAEAERMVKAFEAAGVPLYVAYYRRGLDRFRRAKELVESGALGRVMAVGYRFASPEMRERQTPVPWRLDAEVSGGGLFLDLASHALDVLDYVVGPLVKVRGTARNVGKQYVVEDTAEMSFSTEGGARGTASWSFIDERVDEYQIVGEKGALRMSCFGNEPLEILWEGGRVERMELPNPKHIQQGLIQLMVDEMNGVARKGSMPSTGASGLRTQRVMDAVLAEYYGGREDGFWGRFRE